MPKTSASVPAVWGNGVRALRWKMRLTQADLAERVGTNQATISRIELDRVPALSDELRVKIALTLRVDPHDLFPYRAPGYDRRFRPADVDSHPDEDTNGMAS